MMRFAVSQITDHRVQDLINLWALPFARLIWQFNIIYDQFFYLIKQLLSVYVKEPLGA